MQCKQDKEMNEQKEHPIQELEEVIQIEEADLIIVVGAELDHLIPEREVNLVASFAASLYM